MKLFATSLALLALCLAPAELPALGHHQSGIIGQITFGRSCDVFGCDPVPTPLRVLIYSDRERLVADIATEPDGIFEVALKPGAYLVASFFLPAAPDAPLVPTGRQPIPVLVEKKDYTVFGVHYVSLPQPPLRPPSPPTIPPPLPHPPILGPQ